MLTRVVNDRCASSSTWLIFIPNCILMDVYMDAVYGDELAKIIRQMEAYVSIPIVYLSRRPERIASCGLTASGRTISSPNPSSRNT